MVALSKRMIKELNSPGTFGLCLDQVRARPDKLVHNGGWYNQAGQRLGWGDLSASDLERVSKQIDDGHAFIVLNEQWSYWNYIRRFPSGDLDEKGIRYVADHALYVILKKKLFVVEEFSENGATKHNEGGVTFDIIHPSKVMDLLKPFG